MNLMTARFRPFLTAALASALLCGATACSVPEKPEFDHRTGGVKQTSLIEYSHAAADRLIENLGRRPDTEKPILVTSLVNVNNLQQSSTLGRIVSEQIVSRLTNSGYRVHELKLRDSFLIRERTGELVLSRNVRDISQEQGAQAVVAGTYAISRDSVLVSLRLIRASDSRILSAHDYALPMDRNLSSLLDRRFQEAVVVYGAEELR